MYRSSICTIFFCLVFFSFRIRIKFTEINVLFRAVYSFGKTYTTKGVKVFEIKYKSFILFMVALLCCAVYDRKKKILVLNNFFFLNVHRLGYWYEVLGKIYLFSICVFNKYRQKVCNLFY